MPIRVCECSFTTDHSGNAQRHKRNCKARKIIIELKEENVRLRALIAARGYVPDATTTSVKNIGSETFANAPDSIVNAMAASPFSAVSSLYKHIRQDPCNRNVLIPNKRENLVRVFTNDNWCLRDKYNVLTLVVHTVADYITSVVDGQNERWSSHHDCICTDKSVMEDTIRQLEMAILSERKMRDIASASKM